MDAALPLTQDLCARICHDLGGPLGALDGALDLAAAGEGGAEALEVAREGAEALRRRLRLWRAAAGAGIGPMGRTGLAELLEGTLAGGRAAADLAGVCEEALPAPMAQALLVAAMIGEALPRGGVVRLAGDAGGLAVWPEGRGATWPAALTAALGGSVATGPREVLSRLLLELAAVAGLRVSLALGGGGAAPPMMLQPA